MSKQIDASSVARLTDIEESPDQVDQHKSAKPLD